MYVNGDNMTYFDSFGVEYIRKEVKRFIGNKNIAKNVHKRLARNSIMCRYFCTEFIDFMLKSKSLLDYTNLFFPNECDKSDKITLIYF